MISDYNNIRNVLLKMLYGIGEGPRFVHWNSDGDSKLEDAVQDLLKLCAKKKSSMVPLSYIPYRGPCHQDMLRFVTVRTSLSNRDIDSLLCEGEGVDAND